jgi:hypothetical protein
MSAPPAFAEVLEHGARQFDAVDLDATPAQRQADPPGPDRELERPPVADQLGQDVDDGIDRGGLVHRIIRVVVTGRDRCIEVAVVVHRSR